MVSFKLIIKFETIIKGSSVGTMTLNHRRIPFSAPVIEAFGNIRRISIKVIVATDMRKRMDIGRLFFNSVSP